MIDSPAKQLSPGFVWLRRLAQVPNRKSQVWTRSDSYVQMLVAVGDPTPVNPYTSHHFFYLLDKMLNILALTRREGWCHDVFCLVENEHFLLNECFLSDSENELPSARYRRFA